MISKLQKGDKCRTPHHCIPEFGAQTNHQFDYLLDPELALNDKGLSKTSKCLLFPLTVTSPHFPPNLGKVDASVFRNKEPPDKRSVSLFTQQILTGDLCSLCLHSSARDRQRWAICFEDLPHHLPGFLHQSPRLDYTRILCK